MLEFENSAIVECGQLTTTSGHSVEYNHDGFFGNNWTGYVSSVPVTYWNSYPVYVCTDKTKKAIEILKALQADKHIECKSVPKFIELVEKIASIL